MLPPRDGVPSSGSTLSTLTSATPLRLLAREQFTEMFRPALPPGDRVVLNVVHAEHQRGRGAALGDLAQNARRLQHAGAEAALFARNRQRQQAGVEQLLKVLERKTCIAIMRAGTPGEILGKQPRLVDR